jgi:hypothetical protein
VDACEHTCVCELRGDEDLTLLRSQLKVVVCGLLADPIIHEYDLCSRADEGEVVQHADSLYVREAR